jgi:hypothetical protein
MIAINDEFPFEQGNSDEKCGYGRPPAAYRFQRGRSGNPTGRPRSGGSSVIEFINAMCAAELTESDLRAIAQDPDEKCARRSAAIRMIRTLENGDIADFWPLLTGRESLESLRASGVNTDAIRRFKYRRIPIKGGFVEVCEIELFDRSGKDFDRVCDRTNGRPKHAVAAAVEVCRAFDEPPEPSEGFLAHFRAVLADGGTDAK